MFPDVPRPTPVAGPAEPTDQSRSTTGRPPPGRRTPDSRLAWAQCRVPSRQRRTSGLQLNGGTLQVGRPAGERSGAPGVAGVIGDQRPAGGNHPAEGPCPLHRHGQITGERPGEDGVREATHLIGTGRFPDPCHGLVHRRPVSTDLERPRQLMGIAADPGTQRIEPPQGPGQGVGRAPRPQRRDLVDPVIVGQRDQPGRNLVPALTPEPTSASAVACAASICSAGSVAPTKVSTTDGPNRAGRRGRSPCREPGLTTSILPSEVSI